MPGNLEVIAKYGTPEEAHLLRNRLEAAGIQAFLEGEAMGAWGWHMANAVGGVKLLVPEEKAEVARKLLAEGGPDWPDDDTEPADRSVSPDRSADSWTCPKCGSEVDRNMDVCWSCGATADGDQVPWQEGAGDEEPEEEIEDGAPESEEPDPPPADVAFLTILFPPTFAYFLFTKFCRLIAPLVPDARPAVAGAALTREEKVAIQPAGAAEAPDFGAPWREAPGTESEEESLDALVLRAWRAAWLGFFLMPPLLMTIYSVWLSVHYWLRRGRPNRRRDFRSIGTMAINLLAVVCLGLLLAWTVGNLGGGVPSGPRMGPVEEEPAPYVGH